MIKENDNISDKLANLSCKVDDYNSEKPSKKYCKIHKAFSHNTKDCKLNQDNKSYKQRNKSKFENYNERNNMIIKEPNCILETLELPIIVNKIDIVGILDTGSTSNYIKEELVEKLNLKINNLERIIESKIANGSTIKLEKFCKAEIQIKGSKSTFFEEFYVYSGLPVEMILGNRFMLRNECNINFKKLGINLGKEFISFSNSILNDLRESPEEAFNEIVFVQKDLSQNVLNQIIEEYKDQNTTFKCIKNEAIRINMIPNYRIVQAKPFPVAFKHREKIKNELERLLDEDIVEEKDVLWSSPGFCIPKKNGELRLVIDYRQVNQYVMDDVVTIPKILENIQFLGNNQMYSKLDLKNGFNQLELKEESRDITGFVVMNRKFRYKRLPFGLKNGPKVFQKVIEGILKGLSGVFTYIDDIVVCGVTREEHNLNLVKVLERLMEHHVRINFEKSIFCSDQIEILGHIIKKNKIEINKNKINNLLKLPEQINKKGIQKIIGGLNWYRMFIPKFSEKILPLTNLLQKDKTLKITDEIRVKIEKLITEIINSSALTIPDFSVEFKLACDASDHGISGVLYQENGVIGHYSRKLNPAESNYTTVEKEFYAIYKSLVFFKNLIQGCQIKIFTDSKNITFQRKDEINKRIERWKTLLNEFDYIMEHVSGKINTIPDLLSRGRLLCNENSYMNLNKQSSTELIPTIISEIIKENKLLTDPEIRKLSSHEIHDEKLLVTIIRVFHEKFGHSGIQVTYNTLKKYYHSRSLYKEIKHYILNCHDCYKCKGKYSNSIRFNSKITSKEMFHKLSMDIYGPIEQDYVSLNDKDSKMFIFTITDVYSRMTRIFPLGKTNTKKIIECLSLWFQEFKKPKLIISDNGKQFVSNEMKEFLGKQDIKQIFTPEYSPYSNGISERVNRTLNEVIRIYSGKSAAEIKLFAERRLNLSYNSGLGKYQMKWLQKTKSFVY